MKAEESNKLINYNYKHVRVAQPKKHQWEGCACFFLARSEILGAVFTRAQRRQRRSSSAASLLLY